MPDRALDPDGALPTIVLRAGGHRMLVYRKMIQGHRGNDRPRDGDLVRVREADQTIGYGLWNGQSQVALRMLSRGENPPDAGFWRQTVDDAIRLRRNELELDAATDAYRVVHAEGDGLPGLIVDRLGPVLSVELFSLGMYQRIGPIVECLSEGLGTTHYRVRMDAEIGRLEAFHPRPFDSPGLPPTVTIQEHGIRYRVRFDGSHKTGFFCDQRDNRHRIAACCRGRDVLDLCCYNAGFGLNARIRGDARDVTCVDLDEAAIAMARDNANLNQVRLRLVHADAFGYARQMLSNGRRYGVVVLDPPKLISTREELIEGKHKYADLNTLAMRIVEPGGYLVTCSCSGLLPTAEFLQILRTAAWRAGRTARVLGVSGAGADHPVRLDVPEGQYLKVVWLRLGDGPSEGTDQLGAAPDEGTASNGDDAAGASDDGDSEWPA